MSKRAHPTPSQQRRTAAVVILLLAVLAAAFTSRWVFYAALAAFLVIGAADLFIELRGYMQSRRKGVS